MPASPSSGLGSQLEQRSVEVGRDLAERLPAVPDLVELDVDGAELGELSWRLLPPRRQRLFLRGGKPARLADPRPAPHQHRQDRRLRRRVATTP